MGCCVCCVSKTKNNSTTLAACTRTCPSSNTGSSDSPAMRTHAATAAYFLSGVENHAENQPPIVSSAKISSVTIAVYKKHHILTMVRM